MVTRLPLTSTPNFYCYDDGCGSRYPRASEQPPLLCRGFGSFRHRRKKEEKRMRVCVISFIPSGKNGGKTKKPVRLRLSLTKNDSVDWLQFYALTLMLYFKHLVSRTFLFQIWAMYHVPGLISHRVQSASPCWKMIITILVDDDYARCVMRDFQFSYPSRWPPACSGIFKAAAAASATLHISSSPFCNYFEAYLPPSSGLSSEKKENKKSVSCEGCTSSSFFSLAICMHGFFFFPSCCKGRRWMFPCQSYLHGIRMIIAPVSFKYYVGKDTGHTRGLELINKRLRVCPPLLFFAQSLSRRFRLTPVSFSFTGRGRSRECNCGARWFYKIMKTLE